MGDIREPFSSFVRAYLNHNKLFNKQGQPTLARINAKILDELYDRYEEKARAWEKAQKAKKRAPRLPTEAETIPPTEEEVRAYCRSVGYNFAVGKFFGYYQSNGWKVGKNSMVSWKAACRTFQGDAPKSPPEVPNLNGDARSGGNPHQEPSDWRTFVSVRWNVEQYPNRERWELGAWSDISQDHRKMILSEMAKK